MNGKKSTLASITMAGLVLVNTTSAFAATKVCLPEAQGVPGRYDAPVWASWAGATGTTNESLNDPRWVGASGHAFGTGGAQPPAEFRGLYKTEGAVTYLYLSWIMRVADADDPNRQLYIGFTPPGGTDSKMLRLRFPATTVTHPGPFTKCTGTDSSCGTAAKYSVYDFLADPADCGGTAAEVTGWKQNTSATAVTWLETATRFWVISPTEWAVQMRIPTSTTVGTSFNTAVMEGTKVFYEIPIDASGTAGGTTTARYSFPRAGAGLQRLSLDDGSLLCKETPNFQNTFTDVVKQSWGSSDPACNGVSLAFDDVGFVHNNFSPATWETASLSSVESGQVWGQHAGSATVNSLLVRPFNQTGNSTPIPANQITATVRIANWGTEPNFITENPTGWLELPIGPLDGSGQPTRSSHDKQMEGSVADNHRGVIKFDWTLNQKQKCEYGLETGAVCGGTTQIYNGWDQCFLVNLKGSGPFEFSSTSLYKNMMFGEMSVFEKPAIIETAGLPWKKGQKYQEIHLFFSPKNLPTQLPAKTQGIGLIAMNAEKLEKQLIAAYSVEDPIIDDGPSVDRFNVESDRPLIFDDVDGGDQRWETPPDDGGIKQWLLRRPLNEKIDRLLPEASELPAELDSLPYEMQEPIILLNRIANLPRNQVENRLSAGDLTRELSEVFSSSAVNELLPSIDVYTYYNTFEPLIDGNKKSFRLEEMSSFSLHTWHDGPVEKLLYVVDGNNVERLSDNHYVVKVKKGKQTQAAINIRVQAKEKGEAEICPDKDWDGCHHGGGFILVGLGAMFAIGPMRRRRRQAK